MTALASNGHILALGTGVRPSAPGGAPTRDHRARRATLVTERGC